MSKNDLMGSDESEVLFLAFRYCFGRMTYAVNTFISYATKNIGRIQIEELNLMLKEINEASSKYDDLINTEKYRTAYNPCSLSPFGMEMDRNQWLSFRNTIIQELSLRKSHS